MKERSDWLNQKIKEIVDNPFNVPILRAYLDAEEKGDYSQVTVEALKKKHRRDEK